MNKNTILKTLLLSSVFLFQGCNEEKLSCNTEGIKFTLLKITEPLIKEQNLIFHLNYNYNDDGMKYAFIKQKAHENGQQPDFSALEGFKKAKNFVENEHLKANYDIDNIETILKNQKKQKVQCIGTIMYENTQLIDSYKIAYEVKLENKNKYKVDIVSFQ